MRRRYHKKRKPKSRQSTPDSSHTEENHSDCRSSLSSRETDLSSDSSLPISAQTVSAPTRRFLPHEVYPDHFTLSDIEVPVGNLVFLACPGSEKKCPHCNRHIRHLDCIVIAIDGACRNNGSDGARASTGAYYGHDHPLNESATLSPKPKQTSQVAELAACQRALLAAHVMQNYWDKFSEMTGDEEGIGLGVLVRGMTEWIFKWKANGWTTAKGLPRYVKVLEDEQVIVQFWHVPREYNQEADKLATPALTDD
ncbi:ribonuclease H-like protein [Aspergillus vadensis CBS 113365]|uniref:ribonuclease H n=1 Tax=Aspergillus vadensis (strain CBS 113365 / IMI 142717 / IBT 24658) TaxID=1448311 RepID=A0A319AXM2_ASPVC|nr:ribonuclease H-like protein [Aspergillus vadensis CBS 113365]PYH64364.1 ribonuclease H-like protein [Aspergillus vadensis CBS 113365]